MAPAPSRHDARGSRSSAADRPARSPGAVADSRTGSEARPLPTGVILRLSGRRPRRDARRDRCSSSRRPNKRAECCAEWRSWVVENDNPSNNSARSSLSASRSSTSYHGGRMCTSMPISSARCSVCRMTCSVLQEMHSKRPAMPLLEAEQVVSAIGRGADHRAIARLRQHARRLDQQRGRQGRTVGIEHDGELVAHKADDRSWCRGSRRSRAARLRRGRSPRRDSRGRTFSEPGGPNAM